MSLLVLTLQACRRELRSTSVDTERAPTRGVAHGISEHCRCISPTRLSATPVRRSAPGHTVCAKAHRPEGVLAKRPQGHCRPKVQTVYAPQPDRSEAGPKGPPNTLGRDVYQPHRSLPRGQIASKQNTSTDPSSLTEARSRPARSHQHLLAPITPAHLGAFLPLPHPPLADW